MPFRSRVRSLLKRLRVRCGGTVKTPLPPHEWLQNGEAVLVKFVTAAGDFDYEQYRQVQTLGNQHKLGNVWVLEANIRFAAHVVRQTVPGQIVFGLCHGTRRGLEQRWFAESLGCRVLGTEISDSASQFPDTLQWDFHEAKPEWLNSTDFIYSNSWDHAYDPKSCLNTWMSCVRPGGVCVLEHASDHEPVNIRAMDPFKVRLDTFARMIDEWGAGDYRVLSVLATPVRHQEATAQHLIVVQKPVAGVTP